MNNQERLKDIKDEFNDDLKLGYTPAEWYEEEMKWLINQAERVDELEEKIKLERRMNKDLHKLVKFLQENPKLAQDRWGDPVSLVAISAMELLQEEKRLAEEECERYKKMFSKEKGKSITLYIQNKRYEQALEFYGDKGNYKTVIENDREIKFLGTSLTQMDGGEVARKVLESSGNEGKSE